MAIPITITKVILPQRRNDTISRQRLLDLLYELLDNKLILVSAPAGYGKTSLLVDFAHQADLPVCWYALDELDNDPDRFVAHLIAAVRQQFGSFGSQSVAVLNSAQLSGLDIDRMVSTLVNEVYAEIREHFLVVIDDFHLVQENEEIDRFLSQFMQQASENCHVVLASRALLKLEDLPLMIARSQVGGLSQDELAFTAEEIRALILQNYHISIPESEAKAIAAETEGWITGLLLSAHTMWRGMADKFRIARASGVGLYDYLAQQVLDQQPAEVGDFLLKSSLLEEFDADLCKAVFGKEQDWPKLMDYVLNNNLFIQPVGEKKRWIRYHHLFRDFLQSRIEQERPEERKGILERMVWVYADMDDWEKAYATTQKIGEPGISVALIEKAGPHLIKAGRVSNLGEWIEALPADIRYSHAMLLSLKGTTEVMRGNVEIGLSLLDQAEARLRESNDIPNLTLNLLRQSDAKRLMGDYPASMTHAEEALELAAGKELQKANFAYALRAVGMNLFQNGRLDEAITALNQSLGIYEALEDRQIVALVQMELGLAHMYAGNFRRSLAYYDKSLEYWRQANDPVREANALNNLGVLHHLRGEYQSAIGCFEGGLRHARQSNYPRMEAYILCGIGDIYSDLGATDEALNAYHQAREIAEKTDNRFIRYYVNLAEASQFWTKRNSKRSKQFLDAARELIRESRPGYETGLWNLVDGKIGHRNGDLQRAIDHLEEAVHLFEKDGHWVEAARANLYLANALHEQGDKASALIFLQNAYRLAEKMESQHILVIPGREAKALLESAQNEVAMREPTVRLRNRIAQFEADIPMYRRQLRPHAKTVPFAPPQVYIQGFGEGTVELDGKPVEMHEWHSQRRVREFFFYLVAQSGGQTKEEIGAVLLPESSKSKLNIQFKNITYKLRLALGQDAILMEDEHYSFNRNLDYRYDVEIFQQKIEEAQATEDLEKKVSALREAIGLYRGPYLLDVEGIWVLPERQRLLRLHINALVNLAQVQLNQGSYDKAFSYCERVLLEDPCYEEAYRLSMLAHAGLGNRAGVMREYQRCREALLEELDARPSDQTEELYGKLIR
jgi:LuxR family maltose regulon positive regulatory protein